MLAIKLDGSIAGNDISNSEFPCFDFSEYGIYFENINGIGQNLSYFIFEKEDGETVRWNINGQFQPSCYKNGEYVNVSGTFRMTLPSITPLKRTNIWEKLYNDIYQFGSKYAIKHYLNNHKGWDDINVGFVCNDGTRVYTDTNAANMNEQECFYISDRGNSTKINSAVYFSTFDTYVIAPGSYMIAFRITEKYGYNNVLLPENEQKPYYGFAILDTYEEYGTVLGKINMTGFGLDTISFLLDKDVSIDSTYIDDIYGPASTSGGYSGGTFDNSSDAIGHPDDPSISYVQQGMGNLYHVENLKDVINEIYPAIDIDLDPAETFFGITKVLKSLFDCYDNKNLMSFLVDCIALPVTPRTLTVEGIKVGHKQLSTTGRPLLTEYVNYDCGTLSIPEYYGNFIDYSGTTIQLFLPFYGFVDIAPEYIQGGSLNVRYKFNAITGEFIATIKAKSSKSSLNSVIGQYSGNACVHMPINGLSYGDMLQATLNSVGGMASTIAGGDLVGMANNAMSGLSAIPTPHSSNSYSAGASYMGLRTPFLLIARDKSHFSATYPSDIGIPCNISYKLGTIQGYTECELDDVSIKATEQERSELVNLLRTGIIL